MALAASDGQGATQPERRCTAFWRVLGRCMCGAVWTIYSGEPILILLPRAFLPPGFGSRPRFPLPGPGPLTSSLRPDLGIRVAAVTGEPD
jgi:hypothetical protein